MARADAARDRLGRWLTTREDVAGVVLTSPAGVAWATGAVAPPVDRTAQSDLVWVVATLAGAALVTTEVEADRVREEYQPHRHGFTDLVAVPWYDPDAFVRAAQDIAGTDAGRLAADDQHRRVCPARFEQLGHAALDVEIPITRPPGRQRLLQRGRCVRAQLPQVFLLGGGQGEPQLDQLPGGDDRVRRFRHPMAMGAPVRQLAMAVVVARRGGLHAAATRFASAGPPPAEFTALRDRVLRIERDTLAACVPPNRYGDVLTVLDQAYDREGTPGGWAGHYQGGPIGYAQREFEIAPSQRDSRWYGTPVADGQAVAWNPSLAGGAKAEDTYLVLPGGLERITESISTEPAWPAEDDELVPPRPAVLEVA
jgi:Xaa-Pro dipeptidase